MFYQKPSGFKSHRRCMLR